jgi:hypothetical protein
VLLGTSQLSCSAQKFCFNWTITEIVFYFNYYSKSGEKVSFFGKSSLIAPFCGLIKLNIILCRAEMVFKTKIHRPIFSAFKNELEGVIVSEKE